MAVESPEAPTQPIPEIEDGVIEDARRRQRRHQFAAAISVGAILAGLIVLLGGGHGAAPSLRGPLNDAYVLRQIERTLAPRPGTIVVQRAVATSYPRTRIGWSPDPASLEEVIETPTHGGQSFLYSDNTRYPGSASYFGVVNGMAMMSLRAPDRIYASSVWGPYITASGSAGKFIYRRPKQSSLGSLWMQQNVDSQLPNGPLTLTAGQAHALLTGADTIVPGSRGAASYTAAAHLFYDVARLPHMAQHSSVVAPVLRYPIAGPWLLLKEGYFAVVGRATVDGRPAIELAGPDRATLSRQAVVAGAAVDGVSMRLWVDARSYAPIRLFTHHGKTKSNIAVTDTTETWLEFKTLPINAASQRLLNPLSLHPRARIDRSYRDFVTATYQQFDPHAMIGGPSQG